ncbi:MAG: hypothetical protein GY950_05730 [bacterium]|nr:hypothetical protein [bacterium]
MSEIKPRFEFRSFAPDFGIVEEKMRRLSKCGKIRESAEIYIMSAGNNENNTKVRDDLMDIKVYVKSEKGLEQWNPRMKGSFPMAAAMIRDDVFPAFGVPVPEFKREQYTLAQFLEEIVQPHGDLTAVNVFKRRFAFTINDCIAELGEVYVNGASIKTVNVESVDVEAILKAMEMLSLQEHENINYLLAIKRIIGMEPLPKNFYLK